MDKSGIEPVDPDKRYMLQTLWVNSTLRCGFSDAGKANTPDSREKLEIALEAVDIPRSARTIARLLASRQPEGSEARQVLTDWWTASLRDDTSTDPWTRLVELTEGVRMKAGGNVGAFYEAQLGQLLTDPATSATALKEALREIEINGPPAPHSRAVINTHAPRVAALVPDTDLGDLLRASKEHALDSLYEAGLAQLPRADFSRLRALYDSLRATGHSSSIAPDISRHYHNRVMALVASSPTHAWDELAQLHSRQGWEEIFYLHGRYNSGRPVITTFTADEARRAFNAYAAVEPVEAAHAAAREIKSGTTTAERLQKLGDMQVQIAESHSPAAQLRFLANLHASLLHQPDLAKPSREQVLKLYNSGADADFADQLYSLAAGDPVLQNTIRPIVGVIPERQPGPLARGIMRLKRWSTGFLPR